MGSYTHAVSQMNALQSGSMHIKILCKTVFGSTGHQLCKKNDETFPYVNSLKMKIKLTHV